MDFMIAHVRLAILETLSASPGERISDEFLHQVLLWRGIAVDQRFVAEEIAWLLHFDLISREPDAPSGLQILGLTAAGFDVARGFTRFDGVERPQPYATMSAPQ